MFMRCIIYKSENLIIQQLAKGTNNIVVIHGSGHTVSVDENDKITFCDPLFIPPKKNTNYGECTVLTVYFPKTCKGLSSASIELAGYINNHLESYRKIILHGHSKCGCCFINLTQWLVRKVTILSVSAPLKGTPIVDLKTFSSRLNSFWKFFYLKIFSDHNVDRDICPNSSFIRNLPIDYAVACHEIHIITSRCGFSLNPIDWILWLMDICFGISGDGIVPLEAQTSEELISSESITQIISSHATSMRKSLKIFSKIFN